MQSCQYRTMPSIPMSLLIQMTHSHVLWPSLLGNNYSLNKYSRVNQKLLYYLPSNCWSLKQKQDDEDCIRIRTIDQRIISNEDRPKGTARLFSRESMSSQKIVICFNFIFIYIQLKQEQEDDEERQQDASS